MTRPVWLGILAVCLLVGALCGFRAFVSPPKYGAQAPGTLNNEFVEKRSRRGGTSYEVTYTFQVNGQSYSGGDTIRTEPRSPATTVFYDPANPKDNALKSTKTETPVMIGLFIAVLGAIGAGKRVVNPQGEG